MVQVKICGLTRLEDAWAAAEVGADLLGFVFHPASPRRVSRDQVREMVAEIRRRFSCQCVGVFVDEGLSSLEEAIAYCQLDLVQLHGQEAPELVRALFPRAIKAFRLRSPVDLSGLARYQAALYLLDTYHPTQVGGTGQTFNWALAEPVAREYPILLAGGLHPDNVGQAIQRVQPWGVDVSSGVEIEPGVKDLKKMRRFIEAAKAVPI